jgi:hypothetical protein
MVLGLASLAACGALNGGVKTQSLGNGEFHLQCKGALANCLEEADNLCMGSRYEVRSAHDDRDYFGPGSVGETEVRTSEAVIWCGPRGRDLFARTGRGGAGGSAIPGPSTATLARSSASDPATSGSPPARACVPGATQVCVGPAACRGGQTCVGDGNAFGACDCGERAADADTTGATKPADTPK